METVWCDAKHRESSVKENKRRKGRITCYVWLHWNTQWGIMLLSGLNSNNVEYRNIEARSTDPTILLQMLSQTVLSYFLLLFLYTRIFIQREYFFWITWFWKYGIFAKERNRKLSKKKAGIKRVQRQEQNCTEKISLFMHPNLLSSVVQRSQCLLWPVCTVLGMPKTDQKDSSVLPSFLASFLPSFFPLKIQFSLQMQGLVRILIRILIFSSWNQESRVIKLI